MAVMGTAITQRMNQETALMVRSAGESAQIVGLRHLADNPDAFLQPATRSALSLELVDAFQAMLANALHTVFIVEPRLRFWH